MAIATRTIQNTIEWAKRFSFNRNPVIGNQLEPALTSANLVMQLILAPPFEWWWNNQEAVFTMSPTPSTATSTTSTIASAVLTVTAANTFAVNNQLLISGFTGALSNLNGQIILVASATPTSFTASVPNFANAGPDTTAGLFTNATTQDYTIALPNFSHIQHASVRDLTGSPAVTPGKWFELKVENHLALETVQARPEYICPVTEDGSGNMTFRLSSAPDKAYPVSLLVQQTAPQITSMNQTWAPMPDFMSYVYNWGFMSFMWHFADDPRAAYAENQFKAGLLARAEGLDEEDINIFLNNWDDLKSTAAMKRQQGIGARGQ